MMERNKMDKQHCCKYLTFLQSARNKICATLSFPTVNAATMYKRVTPPDETSVDESQEKTGQDINFDSGDTIQSETEPKTTSPLQLEIAKYAALEAEMTGWERIKRAYGIDYRYQYTSVEYYDLVVTFLAAAGLGIAYGGVPGLRIGKKRYIEKSGAVAYETRFHAVSESLNAANRGLVRYGYRWGWRVTFIATSFQLISQMLSWYRNKVDLVNYGVAAGSVGAIYRINLGLKGMVGGSVAGLVVGLPAGVFMLAMQKLSGETSLERSRRMRAQYMLEYRNNIGSSIELQGDAVEYMSKVLKDVEEQKNKDAKS